MFRFRRKKKASPAAETADTFVEATGGGWPDPPDTLRADGGLQADFVRQVLEKAQAYAKNNVPVGHEFEFVIKDIPVGITSPHEIVFGLMMRATGLRTSFRRSNRRESVFHSHGVGPGSRRRQDSLR